MSTGIAFGYIGVAVLIGFNAFFVAIEFAVVASRRTRIEGMVAEGSGAAGLVLDWVESQERRDRLIAAAQVGITAASLALGYLGEAAFASVLEPIIDHLGIEASGLAAWLLANLAFLMSLLVVTGLHVTFGEQIPKVVTLRNPEGTAVRFARPMAFFIWIARPFIWVLDTVTGIVLRFLGTEPVGGHSTLYTVDELKQIVEESEQEGVLDAEHRELLHAVFDFGDLMARQVMIPRTEMICLQADECIDHALDLAAETLLTKFPVYEDDLDSILGVLHTKDLVRAVRTSGGDAPVRHLVRESIFVPESIPVDTLLARFRQRRQHIAIVLDEFGGTAGLVTLEDLMEELVGDVQDAFDRAEPEIRRLSDTAAQIDGLALIEEVNEAFDLSLSDPNYDTIAGYVLGRLGHVGKVGDVTEAINNGKRLRFRIEAMDGLRIALLRLELSVIPSPSPLE
jgi:CBS domain containing-hemolysin-like protein